MERLYADNLDAHVDALAYHYARTSDLRRAVDYLLKAGAAARAVFANGPAVAYFQGALDRLAQLDAEGQETAARNLERRLAPVGAHLLCDGQLSRAPRRRLGKRSPMRRPPASRRRPSCA